MGIRPARTRRAPRADRRGHEVRAPRLPQGEQGSRECRGPREEAAEHSGWRRRCTGPALRTGWAGSPSSEGYGRRWGGKPTETGSGRRAGRPWGPVCVAPGPRARAAPGMPTVSWPRSQAPGGPSQALGQSARPHLAAAGPWPVAQATRGKGHVTAQGPRQGLGASSRLPVPPPERSQLVVVRLQAVTRPWTVGPAVCPFSRDMQDMEVHRAYGHSHPPQPSPCLSRNGQGAGHPAPGPPWRQGPGPHLFLPSHKGSIRVRWPAVLTSARPPGPDSDPTSLKGVQVAPLMTLGFLSGGLAVAITQHSGRCRSPLSPDTP